MKRTSSNSTSILQMGMKFTSLTKSPFRFHTQTLHGKSGFHYNGFHSLCKGSRTDQKTLSLSGKILWVFLASLSLFAKRLRLARRPEEKGEQKKSVFCPPSLTTSTCFSSLSPPPPASIFILPGSLLASMLRGSTSLINVWVSPVSFSVLQMSEPGVIADLFQKLFFCLLTFPCCLGGSS